VAAQLLNGQGFKEVYNFKGGMNSWHGLTATGPVELSLDLIRGEETPTEMIEIAFGLEGALQKFYLTVGETVTDQSTADLLKKLAAIEEKHQQMLLKEYDQLTETPAHLANQLPEILEGGFRFSEFLSQNRSVMQTISGVLDLALMLETQALDLYLRFALKTKEVSTKSVLYTLADQEKAHLASLGELAETQTSSSPLL
jgi:rubrerythrin